MGGMKKVKVLLPLLCGYDNRMLFSFAMQFTKQTQGQVTVLSTYVLPFNDMQSQESYAKAVEIEKERIHLNMLKLIGYYQCFYNRWNLVGKVKVRILEKEGSIEQGIFSELKANSDFILLLNQEYFHHMLMDKKFINKLVRSKIKILSVPSDKDFYTINPEQANKNFNVGSDAQFERMLMAMEIYNMPADINLFRQDIMLVC